MEIIPCYSGIPLDGWEKDKFLYSSCKTQPKLNHVTEFNQNLTTFDGLRDNSQISGMPEKHH